MRHFVKASVLPLVLFASGATAQGVREYTCIATDNVTDHYWFGAGVFQMAEDRQAGSNECAEPGAVCVFDGTKFVAGGHSWDFTYDNSTGAYSLHFSDGYKESGTCRPD